MIKNLQKVLISLAAVGGLILASWIGLEPETAEAANTGSIYIRAWVDTDGDNTYSLNEGLVLKGTRFEIRDMATNKLIDKSLCRFDDFMLGGVGRNNCNNLPYGKYMVTYTSEDPFQYAGPIKSKWNPKGVNPIAPVEIKKGFENNILDFGYKPLRNPQTGDMIIHAFKDKDFDGQWSGYNSGEGDPFFNTKYSVKSVKTGKNIDYSRHCNFGTNRLGGAGEDICRGLPAGQYIVTFYGAGTNWVQIKGVHNDTASNPMLITVTGGQIVTPEFGYNPKSVINVRVFEDINGNKAYTPNTNEGKAFSGKKVKIVDNRGNEIDYTRCSTESAAVGGAGRIWCAVPQGPYSVWFADFDATKWNGPLKTQYNPQGIDPVPTSANPNKFSVIDFGFIKNGYVYQ